MERFIADLVRKFETGTISRRDFCEGRCARRHRLRGRRRGGQRCTTKWSQDARHQSHLLCVSRLPQGARFLQLRAGHGEIEGRRQGTRQSCIRSGARQGRRLHRRAQCRRQCSRARASGRRSCLLHDRELERRARQRRVEGEWARTPPGAAAASTSTTRSMSRSSSLPRKRKTRSFEEREQPPWKVLPLRS